VVYLQFKQVVKNFQKDTSDGFCIIAVQVNKTLKAVKFNVK